jgi:hypothetical protein
MTPAQVEKVAAQEGWFIGKMAQGTHAGQGFMFRQCVPGRTDWNGNVVEWHPGGGHHGPEPYWKVS